ncbi:hypothetical protein N8E89_10635 [Phyllobacterium sp. A18/5-2]|uniref:hypothetical protein n=1 Tax=Phyllobacterium sp. A18/5-2 TaxID=2978392 RepID=UPI0021C56E70|nr:hypothetical protein [Phyllobacterium sp. A18/5-2]UXN63123.1 hypothetical protein N8E89_10635 [Phyllobacterium sp. A18/5-2]
MTSQRRRSGVDVAQVNDNIDIAINTGEFVKGDAKAGGVIIILSIDDRAHYRSYKRSHVDIDIGVEIVPDFHVDIDVVVAFGVLVDSHFKTVLVIVVHVDIRIAFYFDIVLDIDVYFDEYLPVIAFADFDVDFDSAHQLQAFDQY